MMMKFWTHLTILVLFLQLSSVTSLSNTNQHRRRRQTSGSIFSANNNNNNNQQLPLIAQPRFIYQPNPNVNGQPLNQVQEQTRQQTFDIRSPYGSSATDINQPWQNLMLPDQGRNVLQSGFNPTMNQMSFQSNGNSVPNTNQRMVEPAVSTNNQNSWMNKPPSSQYVSNSDQSFFSSRQTNLNNNQFSHPKFNSPYLFNGHCPMAFSFVLLSLCFFLSLILI